MNNLAKEPSERVYNRSSPHHVVEGTETRICLRCNKEFKSCGNYNRICVDCNYANLGVAKRDQCSSPCRSIRVTQRKGES